MLRNRGGRPNNIFLLPEKILWYIKNYFLFLLRQLFYNNQFRFQKKKHLLRAPIFPDCARQNWKPARICPKPASAGSSPDRWTARFLTHKYVLRFPQNILPPNQNRTVQRSG